MSLNPQTLSALNWITDHLAQLNGNYFRPRPIDITIECDASLVGWSALSHGEVAQGRWSELEISNDINYLKLLAAFYALQAFVGHERTILVRLKVDNSSALSYINNMGGIRFPCLDSLSRLLWELYIGRDIFVSAQHVSEKLNFRTDALSRDFSWNLEWSLVTEIFEQLLAMTFILDTDLFASIFNTKFANFVSWHPEPGAITVDAFRVSWSSLKCYAFPPFSLLPQVLRKVHEDKALVLLIAPVWTTQGWYPVLLQLLMDQPFLLPKGDTLLPLPHSNVHHPLKDDLVLVAWILSGNPLETEVFLMKQPASSVLLGPLGLISNTIQRGESGVAGVTKDKLIYFRHP